jgi:hypothetical protein
VVLKVEKDSKAGRAKGCVAIVVSFEHFSDGRGAQADGAGCDAPVLGPRGIRGTVDRFARSWWVEYNKAVPARAPARQTPHSPGRVGAWCSVGHA